MVFTSGALLLAAQSGSLYFNDFLRVKLLLLAAAAGPAEWDRQLGQWALACLQAGARDLHAEARERFDQALLTAALQHTGARRVEAASLLGVGRNTVTRKLGPGRKRR